mgnify:CR=1 FL=1
MKIEYDFGYTKKTFDLSERDAEHIGSGHKTKMREWDGPISRDALSGVDWDKVNKGFPFYSLRCRDCDYKGDNYNQDGSIRT